jgi:hypothetical protein
MSNDSTDVSIRISLPAHIIAKCKEIQITNSNDSDKYSIQIIDSNGTAKYVSQSVTRHDKVMAHDAIKLKHHGAMLSYRIPKL